MEHAFKHCFKKLMYVLDSDDVEFLKQHYNRLNFSGTAHKESERAI